MAWRADDVLDLRCPLCGRELAVRRQYSGDLARSVGCRSCGSRYVVRALLAHAADDGQVSEAGQPQLMDDEAKARKLEAVEEIVGRMLDDADKSSRASLPEGNEYAQGRKDVARVILALIREDPSIIEDAASY